MADRLCRPDVRPIEPPSTDAAEQNATATIHLTVQPSLATHAQAAGTNRSPPTDIAYSARVCPSTWTRGRGRHLFFFRTEIIARIILIFRNPAWTRQITSLFSIRFAAPTATAAGNLHRSPPYISVPHHRPSRVRHRPAAAAAALEDDHHSV